MGMKNNVIYIAGKITGDPNYMEKFLHVANCVRRMGYIPLLPTVLPPGMQHPQYMKICLPMIDVAAMAIFMKDWPDSIGATIENDHCKDTGKPWVVTLPGWEKEVVNRMRMINKAKE